MIDTTDFTRVKVNNPSGEHWDWCSKKVKAGKWCAKFGILQYVGQSYYFKDPEDAVAFRLAFGIFGE